MTTKRGQVFIYFVQSVCVYSDNAGKKKRATNVATCVHILASKASLATAQEGSCARSSLGDSRRPDLIPL